MHSHADLPLFCHCPAVYHLPYRQPWVLVMLPCVFYFSDSLLEPYFIVRVNSNDLTTPEPEPEHEPDPEPENSAELCRTPLSLTCRYNCLGGRVGPYRAGFRS